MQSKISLYKKELFKHMARNAGWISLIYFITLLFCLPLDILMTETNQYREFWVMNNLFNYNQGIQIILLITVPILLAIFLFRFLHVKNSSDLFHSLPIKRSAIFHQYTLTGLVFLIVPVLVTACLVLIEHRAFDLDPYFSVNDILYWAGITIVLNIVVFMGAVFTAMFTGISIIHGVLSYIFLLLPVGLIVLLTYNLQFFLYGFPDQYFLSNRIEFFSPLVITDRIAHTTLNASVILSYLSVTIILYVVAAIVYKKRPSEAVSQAIAFPILKPIFTFGTTVCTAFLAALYFGETQGHSTFWLIFGYVSGSLAGYLGAVMVLNKTWRVLGEIRGYVYYAGAMLIILLALHFDVMQYENKVPEVEDIKQVHLSNSPYLYYDSEYREKTFYLRSKENINLVQQLHQSIVENKMSDDNISRYNRETAFFAYELKSGKKVVREYEIDKSKYKEYYQPIHESLEFKEVTNPIFDVKSEDIKLISINPVEHVFRSVSISNHEEVAEVLTILKEEILSSTYDEMYNERGFQSYISILLNNNKSIDLPYRPSYEKLKIWLTENDLDDRSEVTENDIREVIIIKKSELENDELDRMAMDHEQFFNSLPSHSRVLRITDKNEIKEAMKYSMNHYMGDPVIKYVAAFYLDKQKYPVIRGYDDKVLPIQVKKYFQ